MLRHGRLGACKFHDGACLRTLCLCWFRLTSGRFAAHRADDQPRGCFGHGVEPIDQRERVARAAGETGLAKDQHAGKGRRRKFGGLGEHQQRIAVGFVEQFADQRAIQIQR
jgi:hypothetical protein